MKIIERKKKHISNILYAAMMITSPRLKKFARKEKPKKKSNKKVKE